MFNKYSNELSLVVLSNILSKLHKSVSKVYTEFDNCVGYDYLIYKLKELKSYLYELSIELKFISEDNSIAMYDLKLELVRVEKEFNHISSLI